eukprot:TRINITY_DN6258_c1_g4_i1.p1 TRINITY_DN6258_c1_g4~~TRINITY_DN6258_c1_g4_i1.p1  ORF type:complete len:528 (-),score=116.74 TRINITY_DN6258_c1_g4_i1:83-1666(-)
MADEQPRKGITDGDEEMDGVEWDAGIEGDELDNDFRNAETYEVEFEDNDHLNVDDDDLDDDGIEDDQEELGVVNEAELYSDEDTGPAVDDALAKVVHKDSVLSVALCPTDRRILLTGGQDDVAVLWNIQEEATGIRCVEKCRLSGHTDSVVQVAFSHDGAYAATGSYDGTVRIWNPKDGALVQTLEGPSKEIEWILWHPKGHAILAGSMDTMAWMWWAPSGKLMQIFAGHAAGVSCGCWGLSGKVIVTGSEDKGVIVWNPRAGSPQHQFREVHEAPIISICSHPDSPIVVTGAEDATAHVIQIETGKVLAPLPGHIDSIESIAFSNAVGANTILLLATGSMDGKVQIWDAKTFSLRCTHQDHAEKGGIVKLKWLPEGTFGNWFCTCSTDFTLKLFNALTGECSRTLQGHSECVLDLDLSVAEAGGGPQLVVASGSEDNSCRIFVVALWTGGSSAQGVALGASSSSAMPAMSSLPSPAQQATGALEAPGGGYPGSPTQAALPTAPSPTTASPGVPPDSKAPDSKNLPV